VWLTGLVDDLRGLSPGIRLIAQILAGLLVAQTQWRLNGFSSTWVNICLTRLFFILFFKAFKFFGVAGGLPAAVVGLSWLRYVLLCSTWGASVGMGGAWTVRGTCLGFLLFNFPPARIFMGDSGSTVLGFLLAFLGLDFYRVHHAIGTHLLLPLIFAGLPLLDL